MATPSADDLPRYHWQLRDAVDAAGKPLSGLFDETGKPLQLDFVEDRVSVSNACNRIGGSYQIVDGHWRWSHQLQDMSA